MVTNPYVGGQAGLCLEELSIISQLFGMLKFNESLMMTMAWYAVFVFCFQFYIKFSEFNEAHKSLKYNLPESEILDITEDVCSGETYSQ